MAELVRAGKIRAIGIVGGGAGDDPASERGVSAGGLQSEYSLWTREPEDTVLPVCRELGIAFVAFSPLGRGFLTGALKPDDLAEGDFRRGLPRFQGDNFQKNLDLVERVREIALAKGCTATQLALAWLLAQGSQRHPDTGDQAAEVPRGERGGGRCGADAFGAEAELTRSLRRGAAAGDRYPAAMMALVAR